MIQKYLQQTKNPEKEVIEGQYTLSDPHHGVVDLYWKENISGEYWIWVSLILGQNT